ncbi:4-coumarate--CoA ligase 1-like [Harmonia axyridis]|uniref:4-coumarate--CoA ligase 1-like n=1 Tax=Harmonia axyridis TaxID=115357 RepID=UPI001E2782EE|nr:4-coumarate--CoA ligase 1-like [Harmonia axyridis]
MEVNIIKGEEFERKITSNLGELSLLVLQTYKDNIVQIDAETGEKLTCWMILEKAKQLARFLIENGVNHGDAVSIMSENRLEFCVVTVGAFFVGATLAPINPQYTAGELNHVMGFSRPKLIFASPSAIPSINGCIRNHSYVRSVIVFGDGKEWNGFRHFDDIVPAKIARPTNEAFTVPHYDPKETIATILCSSGTSGVPKGVKTSHDNITACLDILSHEISKMNIDKNEDRTDSMVGVTPFYHSFGFLTMFTHLLRGKTLVVFRKYKLKIFLDAIVKYKIRSLVIPPPLIVSLLKDEIVKQYDLSCIKEVYIGAAAIGKETELSLQKRFKIRHAAQSYGMTETTWGVIMNPHSKAKMGSVGKILPGMMAKVINETGKPLGAYQEGELCLKGPMIMKGYVKDEAATRSCIDEDNWLHTGDVAYYDNEGFFFIVDRLKELIKYKGFQVSPSELEDLLISHPAIADVAVIGIPDEYAGELPKAFVVKKPYFALSEEEVQDFVSKNVSPHKQLRGGVTFLQEIPRNPNGKILRRVLRDNAQKLKFVHKL